MVRIAPVRFPFNPKALWFDAGDFEPTAGDPLVVLTARGLELGYLDAAVFEATEAQISALSSPLKPVRRIASDEDVARANELEQKSREAMPVFRELAAAKAPDMNPVAVEFLFDGDKAVFYFESEERIDFRDLVRDLAAQFHVRVDMKQIGVRDEARMVGGIGHCGQELCCARLGGDFNPVSIRMAKEQGLSLNPQKISGLCGRLMCCLRYEYDAYKDFHNRAPKKNAKVQTPDGEGKVVDMDVPRETIAIVVEDEKPVNVPLADMEVIGDGVRPNSVGEEAWERAHAVREGDPLASSAMLALTLTEKDKLADASVRTRETNSKKSAQKQASPSRSSRKGSGRGDAQAPAADARRQRRRRSTKVVADGEVVVSDNTSAQTSSPAASRSKAQKTANAPEAIGAARQGSRSRRRRTADPARRQQDNGSAQGNARQNAQGSQSAHEAKSTTPGRKSSALRAREHGGSQQNAGGHQRQSKKSADAQNAAGDSQQHEATGEGHRVRRRSHKADASAASSDAQE